MTDQSLPQRTCPKCGQTYPATTDHFYRQKAGKYGLNAWCKICHRATNNRNLQRRRENDPGLRERERQYKKDYRRDNPEKTKRYNREYYRKNRTIELKRIKQNRKRFADRTRIYKREYYQKNKERESEKNRIKHRRRMKTDPAYVTLYRVHRRNRKARVRNAMGTHTAEDIQTLYADQEGRCGYCGLTVFDEYHIDHMTPITQGGSNGIENLLIACPDCNLSKSDKTVAEWQAMRGW